MSRPITMKPIWLLNNLSLCLKKLDHYTHLHVRLYIFLIIVTPDSKISIARLIVLFGFMSKVAMNIDSVGTFNGGSFGCGESLFLRKIFPGFLLKNQQKTTRPPIPSAAPIRPTSLASQSIRGVSHNCAMT